MREQWPLKGRRVLEVDPQRLSAKTLVNVIEVNGLGHQIQVMEGGGCGIRSIDPQSLFPPEHPFIPLKTVSCLKVGRGFTAHYTDRSRLDSAHIESILID